MKVLIADDALPVRIVLRSNLERWGHEVVQAADGDTALQCCLDDDPPDVAILDWMMPGHSGVEICQILENRTQQPFIYRILITGKTQESDLIYALDHGAHNFLSKPISQAVLRAHIDVGGRLLEANRRARAYAEQMKELATTDPLTGLFNRRHFFENAAREFERARRYGHRLAVMLVDVDHFKKINDEHGHAVGDLVLTELAQRMTQALRNTDLIARFGGEEFVMLLPETDLQAAGEVADRLQKHSRQDIHYQDLKINLNLSIGLTASQPDDMDIDTIIHRADKAMYKAKADGRNRIVNL